jgi:uncharacterized protein (DUF427 family)
MRPVPLPVQLGQESVWDYPRPPRIEDCNSLIRIIFNGLIIVQSRHSKRVLETSHPPVYYIPMEDVCMEYLVLTPQRSYCEWKGEAGYYSVNVGRRQVKDAAWNYLVPRPEYKEIADHIAFYARPMDACYVGSELVRPQPSSVYGGWITSNIVGPFKGEPGSESW